MYLAHKYCAIKHFAPLIFYQLKLLAEMVHNECLPSFLWQLLSINCGLMVSGRLRFSLLCAHPNQHHNECRLRLHQVVVS